MLARADSGTQAKMIVALLDAALQKVAHVAAGIVLPGMSLCVGRMCMRVLAALWPVLVFKPPGPPQAQHSEKKSMYSRLV